MKISIRHFPSTKEVIINGKNPTVKSLFDHYTEISPSTHRVARGITYLNLEDSLIEGEILNIIPI